MKSFQHVGFSATQGWTLDEESYRYRDYKQAPNPTAWDAFIGHFPAEQEHHFLVKQEHHFPVEQDVLEERVEDLPSTDQPLLQSGQASMTTEPTLQTNAQLDPPIAAHPTTDGIRRSTREKHLSFKLRSAFLA
jgi:hypothetical protein